MPLSNFGIVKKEFINNKYVTFYRGAQPDKEGFQTLVSLGVEVTYKLNYDKEFSHFTEGSLFGGTVAVDEYEELFRFEDLNRVIISAKRIDDYFHKSQKSIFVHCLAGRDRTGLMVGAWQIIYDNKTYDEVNDERHTFGCNPFIDFVDLADKLILKEIYKMKQDREL